MYKSLVVLLLPLIALAAEDDVLDLSSHTVDSFKSEIGLHDTVLVELFAPWCGRK